MVRAITAETPAEEAGNDSSKIRSLLKKLSWKNTKKLGAKTWAFIWKWKWPIIAVAVVAIAYFFGGSILWFLGRLVWGIGEIFTLIAMLIGLLLGGILQLALVAIVMPSLCLWTVISHLLWGADLTVSYDYWPCSSERWNAWNSVLNWGPWTLEGWLVYGVGGLTGLLLAYLVIRKVSEALTERAQTKRRLAEQAIAQAEEKRQAELTARFEEGKTAGIREEQAIERMALIHSYKPRRNLPAVPTGHTRLFWINIRLRGPNVWPTKDRAIHWADIEGAVPTHMIGAPTYQMVASKEGDNLAFMDVVYKLNNEPTAVERK